MPRILGQGSTIGKIRMRTKMQLLSTSSGKNLFPPSVEQGQQIIVGAVDAQATSAELAAEAIATAATTATTDTASATGRRRSQFRWV